jgi:hypothetical protein
MLKRIERVRRRKNPLTGGLDDADPDAIEFVELLGRLREGRCTTEDFNRLNTRLITQLRPNWNDSRLRNLPVIVSQNELKDALNEKAARAYAIRTGQDLHWYYATDTRSNGTVITDPSLREHLVERLHSGQTSYRLGRLPLAMGMPVMITQNFDVQNGIVNGTTGIVKRIRYRINESGERIATSCIVYVPDMTGPALPNLPPKHAAVLAETVDTTFTHPDSHKKCVVKRTQLPLVPAFAMTAHKAQGKTMEAIIADLESTKGTEAPYVMLSRAKSLDGIFILRPFRLSAIQCHPSQDVRNEYKRLDMLCHQTTMKYGSAAEAAESQDYLVKTFSADALRSKIRALTGFQMKGYTPEELVPYFIEVLNTPEKKIEYIMTSLTSSKEIYKHGGHVIMKSRDQTFRLHFDNRRCIISEESFEVSNVTNNIQKTEPNDKPLYNLAEYSPLYSGENSNENAAASYVLLDSRPVKDVTESRIFRYLMKSSRNSAYNKETSGASTNSYKGIKDILVRNFLKGLLHVPPKFNLRNDFYSYADIIAYLQSYDPSIN